MRYVDPKSFDLTQIQTEKLKVATNHDTQFDKAFKTKPIGYFKDAFIRFRKNKGSVVAGIILLGLVMCAIFAPYASPYKTDEFHEEYAYLLPKNPGFAGTGFWDGTKYLGSETMKQYYYDLNRNAVVGDVTTKESKDDKGATVTTYGYRRDSYKIGCKYHNFTETDFKKYLESVAKVSFNIPAGQTLAEYLAANPYDYSKTFLKPIRDITWTSDTQLLQYYQDDANYDYMMYTRSKQFNPILTSDGKLNHFPQKDDYPETDVRHYAGIYKTSTEWQTSLNKEGYVYFTVSGSTYSTIVNYDDYYVYEYGSAPVYYFGSDNHGRDIYTRLWHGARLSLILGVCVAAVNIFIGLIYGAIEGYYGGTTDLIMERVSDILVEIPSLVLLTLFQIYFASTWGPIPSLILAFILTGWIGMASNVRMQFYRYKRQEYVLAARTLGAKDKRLIFRHILPNAIGTLITSCVLMIPGVIFTESTLSFLNIIDLESSAITSIGTMLSAGQDCLLTSPHVLIFPAIFISILMICFNLFGNGLRDAFNPSLRGVEE